MKMKLDYSYYLKKLQFDRTVLGRELCFEPSLKSLEELKFLSAAPRMDLSCSLNSHALHSSINDAEPTHEPMY